MAGGLCCTRSHLKALKAFLDIDGPDWALILEDDAVLAKNVPAFLAAFEASPPPNVLLVRAEAASVRSTVARPGDSEGPVLQPASVPWMARWCGGLPRLQRGGRDHIRVPVRRARQRRQTAIRQEPARLGETAQGIATGAPACRSSCQSRRYVLAHCWQRSGRVPGCNARKTGNAAKSISAPPHCFCVPEGLVETR